LQSLGFSGLSDFDDFAVLHPGDAVGKREDARIVGDNY
jgi:hypothetical protein